MVIWIDFNIKVKRGGTPGFIVRIVYEKMKASLISMKI